MTDKMTGSSASSANGDDLPVYRAAIELQEQLDLKSWVPDTDFGEALDDSLSSSASSMKSRGSSHKVDRPALAGFLSKLSFLRNRYEKHESESPDPGSMHSTLSSMPEKPAPSSNTEPVNGPKVSEREMDLLAKYLESINLKQTKPTKLLNVDDPAKWFGRLKNTSAPQVDFGAFFDSHDAEPPPASYAPSAPAPQVGKNEVSGGLRGLRDRSRHGRSIGLAD